MAATLEQLAEKRTLVTVSRAIEDVENVHGFVLATSEDLVLLHEVNEFHLDGFRILRRVDIARARHSQYERYRAAILKSEKQLKNVGLSEELEIDRWESAFRSLKGIGRNLIVEAEHPEVDEFLIGKIVRVNKKSVTLRNFDALGMWDQEPRRLGYDDITSVTFDNEYVTIFSKYLRDS